MQKTLLPIMLVFLVGLVAAQMPAGIPPGYMDGMDIDAAAIIAEAFNESGELKPEYSGLVEGFDISEAPPEVLNLIDGERSNIVLELDNGEEVTIGIAIEDGKIQEVKKGGLENPTSEIRTSEQTIENIAFSDDPAGKFTEEFSQGSIRYEPKSPDTWWKGLVLGILAFLMAIVNFAMSIFGFLLPPAT